MKVSVQTMSGNQEGGEMTESATETAVTEKTPVKESNEQISKAELMDLIEGLITDSSVIRRARLWNPYDVIIGGGTTPLSKEDAIFKKSIKADGNGEMPPALIPDIAFSEVRKTELRSWGLMLQESTGDVPMDEAAFKKEKDWRSTEYLRWGRNRLKMFRAGNCSIFAAVTLGLLSSRTALPKLPGSIVIEQSNFSSSDGHAFLIVNRNGGTKISASKLTDPTSWGPDAFVIDAWYANQKRGKPGTTAVKNVTGTDGDAYYDKAFLDWFKRYVFRMPTAFTYQFMDSVTG